MASKRRAPVPEIPTVIEGGLPGYEILIWNALFAPRATPPAIIARLNGEVNKILELPDIREAFNKQGAEVSGSSQQFSVALPEGLAARDIVGAAARAGAGLLGCSPVT